MQKLVGVIALGALALAGWQTLEASRLREALDTQRGDLEGLRTSLAELSRAERAEPGALEIAEPRPAPEPVADASAPDAPVLVARSATPAELAQAVRDVEARLAAQEERADRMEESISSGQRPFLPSSRRFVHDVDDAVRTLSLDDGQKGELERIIEDLKYENERLLDIPNAEGKRFADLKPAHLQVGSGETPDITQIMTNNNERWRFLGGKVPGTDETYAQAQARIRKDAKNRFRRTLTPEQLKTCDNSHVDPLFHTGGSGVTYAFSTASLELPELVVGSGDD